MLKIIKEKELENSLESSSSSSDLSESLSDSLIDKAEIKKQKTEKKVVLTKEQSLRKIETKNLKAQIDFQNMLKEYQDTLNTNLLKQVNIKKKEIE